MSIENLLHRKHNAFYNGQWHHTNSGEVLSVTNPSDVKQLAQINASTAADVELAVTAAAAAYPKWRETSAVQRASYLRGFAGGLKSRFDNLVRLQMLNNGKPEFEAEMDVNDAIACFDYYAELAEQLDDRQGEVVELDADNLSGKTRYEPLGPVGMIVPWNFPLVTSAWKIAPALAAGCTAVMKNSEITPLIELTYGDIAQEIGLPPGVFNILTGAVEAGTALTADKRLRKISFTGSNMVGAKVMQAISSRCLPLSLELGGKSPLVVLNDADIDKAVECIMAGIFFNCGQMCSATSRLVIDETIADDVIGKLVTKTQALSIGSGFDAQVNMGPVTSPAQYEKILRFFEQAKKENLNCLTGGKAISNNGGLFVEPTIYTDVPQTSAIWRDEIFGPVLAIKTFKTEQQAIELANDSEFGLVATIVSKDLCKAQWAAAQIDGGHVWINSPQVIYPNTAWGGFKSSGIGRELGPWGLNAYLGVKHLTICN